jgi:hypothetical protein
MPKRASQQERRVALRGKKKSPSLLEEKKVFVGLFDIFDIFDIIESCFRYNLLTNLIRGAPWKVVPKVQRRDKVFKLSERRTCAAWSEVLKPR